MAYIVRKKINGGEYYYMRESVREGEKVKSKNVAYLGKNKEEAKRKFENMVNKKTKIEDKDIIIDEEIAYKIVYMCDDHIGYPEFIGKELSLDKSEVSLILNKLADKNYIKKDNRDGGYFLTDLGKEFLINYKPRNNLIGNNKVKNSSEISVDEMAAFCKRKGFVYPSGEIYGGLSGFWDFGVLGAEMKKNLKNEWWKYHVYQRDDIVGIDGAIVTNPKVWEASGHVASFVDVAVVNKKTKEKFKVDKYEVKKYENNSNYEIKGEFNPMFTTQVGPVVEDSVKAYLRPETAQLIFADFKLVFDNARLKLPCGIAQQGKAFRNEIAPRDFLFRCREFEQMEIEYFVNPEDECPYKIPDVEIMIYSSEMQKGNEDARKMKLKEALESHVIKNKWHAYWIANEYLWFISLGANKDKFRIRQHVSEEKAHYSQDTWDLEYEFPFGWKELLGFADRGNFDLSQHEKFSGKDLHILDEKTGKKILPQVVCEPSLGFERAFLVFMFSAYSPDEKRQNVILKLNPRLAPVKAAIFPIIKKDEYEDICREILEDLRKEWNVIYDKSGSIGRRYARNDEAGTPYCITIDEDSTKQQDVTIRERDTTKQIRVKIKDLKNVLRQLIDGEKEFEDSGKLV